MNEESSRSKSSRKMRLKKQRERMAANRLSKGISTRQNLSPLKSTFATQLKFKRLVRTEFN